MHWLLKWARFLGIQFSFQKAKMKASALVILVPTFVVSVLCSEILANEWSSARAVQILTPVNHSFHLELIDLKAILENDDIKDHYAVVVSIAGAFRQGKSFLSNFFIKYLEREVSTFLAVKKLILHIHLLPFD